MLKLLVKQNPNQEAALNQRCRQRSSSNFPVLPVLQAEEVPIVITSAKLAVQEILKDDKTNMMR